jgi:hypothetical protein
MANDVSLGWIMMNPKVPPEVLTGGAAWRSIEAYCPDIKPVLKAGNRYKRYI